MWYEVIGADAFPSIEENWRPVDFDMAQKLGTHILSAGGSEDAAELYMKFRGSMPDATAMLKGRGLAK